MDGPVPVGPGVVTAEHRPRRPIWVCAVCGKPWPCLTAQVDLLTEYADVPTALVMYLVACFLEAVAAHPTASAERLYLRFLGWLQLRQPATPVPPRDGFSGTRETGD